MLINQHMLLVFMNRVTNQIYFWISSSNNYYSLLILRVTDTSTWIMQKMLCFSSLPPRLPGWQGYLLPIARCLLSLLID